MWERWLAPDSRKYLKADAKRRGEQACPALGCEAALSKKYGLSGTPRRLARGRLCSQARGKPAHPKGRIFSGFVFIEGQVDAYAPIAVYQSTYANLKNGHRGKPASHGVYASGTDFVMVLRCGKFMFRM
jgi:hypothetical protein